MDIRCAPCEVCGSASSGFHFGVLACEGCKGFYRRAVKFNLVETYKCLTGQNDCEVSIKSRKCQKCRYAKCVVAGMAPEASRTGRPTKVRQAEIRQQLEQLRKEDRLLPAPATLPPHLLQQQREKQERAASRIAKKAAKKQKSATICVKDRKSSMCGTNSNDAMDAMETASTSASTMQQCSAAVPVSPAPSITTSVIVDSSITDLPVSTPMSIAESYYARHILDSVGSALGGVATPKGEADSTQSPDDGGSQAIPRLSPVFARPLTAMADSSSGNSETVDRNSSASLLLQQQLQALASREIRSVEDASKKEEEQNRSELAESLNGALATILMSTSDTSGLREFITPARDLTSLDLDQLSKIVREDSKAGNAMSWLYNSGREWFNADLAALFGCPPIDDPYHIYRRYVMPMQNLMNPSPNPVTLSLPVSDPSPLNFLPSLVSARTEWLIQRVVRSAAYLSKIQSTRTLLTDRNLELTDVWRRLLSGFELNAVHMINFIKSLPGFTHIDLQDRILLTTHAMMPLLYAQLSLDFDPNTETVNFFSMSRETAELVLSTYAGPDKLLYLDTFRKHFVDAGYAIKSSSLTIVEFGLLCALIFFNTAIPGLKDPAKVETVRLELSHAAEAFVYGNFPSSDLPNDNVSSPSPSSSTALPSTSTAFPGVAANMNNAANRINNFRSLVSYFRNLNMFASWLRGLTLQVHPYLVECSGQVFREMHTQMEQSIKNHHSLQMDQLKAASASSTQCPMPDALDSIPGTSSQMHYPPYNLAPSAPSLSNFIASSSNSSTFGSTATVRPTMMNNNFQWPRSGP